MYLCWIDKGLKYLCLLSYSFPFEKNLIFGEDFNNVHNHNTCLPRLPRRWWYYIGLAMKFKQKSARYFASLMKLFLLPLLSFLFLWWQV